MIGFENGQLLSFFTKNHCNFLDEKTGKCTVYKERFEKNPDCLSVEKAISQRALPNDCPYVKDKYGYQGPSDLFGVFKKKT